MLSKKDLLLKIAKCEYIPIALKDSLHDCHKIVSKQSGNNRQLPEPWTGDIENAQLLFVSSNPSLGDEREVFPKENMKDWTNFKIYDFFENRLSGDDPVWTKKGIRYLRTDGSYGSSTQWVRYWASIKARASEILGKSRDEIRPGIDFALTEVVHCKSKEQKGVNNASAFCSDKYLLQILNISNADIIICMGCIAKKEVLKIVDHKNSEEFACKVLISDKKRVLVFLPHPNAHQRKKHQKKKLNTKSIGYINKLRGELIST